MGEAMAEMLAVFAKLERSMIAQRVSDALAVKKAKGWRHPAWKRQLPPTFRRRVLKLHAEGLSQRAIAAALGTHKETVSRVLRQESA
jgi:DNA invertase Pin-like site-specific DNA recombinase